jgi:ferredoxin--NADP+ reductase
VSRSEPASPCADPPPISVAIIGAGPAGFYAAEALLQRGRRVYIDLIERLPTPYGLIRAGVAPDHQATKRVAARFEKTALQDAVRYWGNVRLGVDVGLDDLLAAYDAVVLAVGSPGDRYLGIPGEDKRGVFGSALFVGWYNGHPDFRELAPNLDTPSAVVIGNGNVALDVARVLVKTPAELAISDIAEHAAKAIRASAVTDVHIVGRRGPMEARFSNVELREMGDLADCVPVVDAADLAEPAAEVDDRERRVRERNKATLRTFADRDRRSRSKRVHFRFFLAPSEILGGERVEAVRFERTRVEGGRAVGTGVVETIPCGLVIPAIGYRSTPIPGVPFDAQRGVVPSNDGRVAPGLYVVGWAKRGPIGVIGSSRPDAARCAEQIAEDVVPTGKPGRAALERLMAERGVRWVGFADWQRIDAAEVAAAPDGAPRRKITSLEAMLGLLKP